MTLSTCTVYIYPGTSPLPASGAAGQWAGFPSTLTWRRSSTRQGRILIPHQIIHHPQANLALLVVFLIFTDSCSDSIWFLWWGIAGAGAEVYGGVRRPPGVPQGDLLSSHGYSNCFHWGIYYPITGIATGSTGWSCYPLTGIATVSLRRSTIPSQG